MRKLSNPTLKDFRYLYHRKKYHMIISVLEKKIFDYYEDLEFFHILGAAYYQTGDLNGAHAFLSRMLKIDPHHVDANILLAGIYTVRGEIVKAVNHCLTALDQNPEEFRARLLLEQLRKKQTRDELQTWVRSSQFRRIQPDIPGESKYGRWIIFLSLTIITSMALYFLWPVVKGSTEPPAPENIREGIRERGIEGIRELLRFDGSFEEVLLASEIENLFREAQKLMLEYRDNEARVLLNRILFSNASDQVREQALKLIEMQTRPDFTADFFSFTPAQILARPKIYDGVYVRWKGSVANLKVGETEIDFDFLVGYHEGKILEAVVPAKIRFAVRIQNGDPIDLLARIRTDESAWFLEVIGIHVMGVRRSP